MARKRSIKPDFFEDADICSVSHSARLLYQAIWCHMDRNALIEDDAYLLRSKAFPREELSTEAVAGWLDELLKPGPSGRARLVRVQWNNKKLLYCPTLKVHNSIYSDEPVRYQVSEGFLDQLRTIDREHGIPGPEKPKKTTTTTSTRDPEGTRTESGRDRKGSQTDHVEEEEEVEVEGKVLKDSENEKNKAGPDILVELWNAGCGGLPKVRELTPARRAEAETAWFTNPRPEFWTEVIKRIRAAPFCNGKGPNGWRADFDWLVRPGTSTWVLEGKYDPRPAPAAKPAGPPGKTAPSGPAGLPPTQITDKDCDFCDGSGLVAMSGVVNGRSTGRSFFSCTKCENGARRATASKGMRPVTEGFNRGLSPDRQLVAKAWADIRAAEEASAP